MEEQTKNMKTVFTVVERGQGKSIWVRVGTGFLNKDGSWNLHLDAVPTNGKLQVREWEPYDRERRGDSPAQDGAPPPPPPRPRPRPPASTSPLPSDAPF
jgi:hypothetical protein